MAARPPTAPTRTALITGATSGLGLQAAIELACTGYKVTLMGRDGARLRNAEVAVQDAAGPQATVTTLKADLSDFDQVRQAANHLRDIGQPLGLLINNAAIMAPPRLMTGPAGYEMQLSVNHLAHHILTARLMPLLTAEPGSRIVTVSSVRAQRGERYGTPWTPLPYDGRQAYATSKLWNLAHALWLDNALHADPSEARSVAAHPGWTLTGLHAGGPFMDGETGRARLRLAATKWLGQPVEQGVVPIMAAAREAIPDRPTYLGPDGFMELRGHQAAPAAIGLAADARFQAWVVARSIELTRTDIVI